MTIPVDKLATVIALRDGALASLAENADTSFRTKIAELELTDDDGGFAGTLVLTDTHAEMFEVIGNVLYLKSGVSLDYESVRTLYVRVQLNENTGIGVNVSVSVTDDRAAEFVVTSNNDINAPVTGDVLTVVLETPDPDSIPSQPHDIEYTYQWRRDGVDIAHASGTERPGYGIQPSYRIQEADEGHSLTVEVRYTDGSGADEVVTTSGVAVAVMDNLARYISVKYDSEGTDGLFVFKAESGTVFRVYLREESGSAPRVVEETHNSITISAPSIYDNAAEIVRFITTEIEEGNITLLKSVELHPNPISSDSYVAHVEQYGYRSTYVFFRGFANRIAEDADTTTRMRIGDIVLIDPDGGNSGTPEVDDRYADTFEVDDNVLYLKAGASLDYESERRITLHVQLKENPSIRTNVQVRITNVDEGVAGFVIRSDNDINVPLTGDLLRVELETPDPDTIPQWREWRDLEYTYQWQRDGSAIDGATRRLYMITEEDEGHSLTVEVRYRDDGYTDEVVTPSGVAVPVTDNVATAIEIRPIVLEGEGTDGFFVFKTEHYENVTINIREESESSSIVVAENTSDDSIIISIPSIHDDATEIMDFINAKIKEGQITLLSSVELHPDSVSSDDFTINGNRQVVVEHARSLYSFPEDIDTSIRVKIADIVLTDADGGNAGTPEIAMVYMGYSGVDVVNESFEIIDNGLYLKAGTSFDYEARYSPIFTIRIQLTETPTIYDTIQVGITDVDEGAASFDVISNGDINAPVVGDVLTATLTTPDPDIPQWPVYEFGLAPEWAVPEYTYQWQRDGIEIADAMEESYMISEDDEGHSLTVKVSYTHYGGKDGDVTTDGITVAVPDNVAPVIMRLDVPLSVDNIATAVALDAGAVTSLEEDADTSARTKIADLLFTDADGSSPGTPKVIGTHADMFEVDDEVDVDEYVLYLKASASLDHESVDTLNVGVQLTEDSTVSVDVSVTINDVNDEAPVITSSATGDALIDGTEVTTDTAVYTARGTSDTVAIEWSLKPSNGDDAGLFSIDRTTGVITFQSATTPDHDGKDSYSFMVVATSGALPAVEQAVTIGVTEASAQPSQAPAQQQPQQGLEFSFNPTYEDLGDDIPPQAPDMV